MATEKPQTPALVSYGTLINFFNQLREHGDLPTRIDRTLMPKASGSQVSAMLAALKFLQLTQDDGKPTDALRQIVLADDQSRKPMLGELIKARYTFLFNDPHFNLEKATSGEMAEKFRSLDISGSTVTKTIAFFLSAAKDADIKVSPHIKPPPQAPRTNGASRKAVKRKDDEPGLSADEEEEDLDVERFEIPVPGKSSVKVIVPSDLDADDWEMLQSMITVYIKRWKGFKTKAEGS